MSAPTSNILVAPLDWGLGHATRCVPLIHQLLDRNHNVILAADGRAWDFLKQEFPYLKLIRLPGYKINYPSKGSFFLKILTLVPAFYRQINKGHKSLKRIIKEYNINAVISDNRYGLWCEKIPSVFIGHQMMIKLPGFMKWSEWLIHKINLSFIKRFDECWIPDYQGKFILSGDLAHKYELPSKFHFLGPLSRFHLQTEQEWKYVDPELRNNLLIILSGPEPQRSILEKKLYTQLEKTGRYATVVRGVTEKSGEFYLNERIRVLHHVNTKELKELILYAGLVVCRPGYSSIMDLAAAGKKAIFIPTPGQTEQLYLARYFFQNKIFYYSRQRSFDLETAVERSAEFEGVQMRYNPSLLEERIKHLEKQLPAD